MRKIQLILLLFIALGCKKTEHKNTSISKEKRNTQKTEISPLKQEVVVKNTNLKAFNYQINSDNIVQEDGYFVTASNLLCRDEPNGNIIHKFSYGTNIKVIRITDQEMTIEDEGKELNGHWAEVEIDETKTGYVFDGFLASMLLDLNIEKIVKFTPVNFIKTINPNGLIKKGKHNIYNKQLQVIGKVKIDDISEVKILSFTKFDRPKSKQKIKYDERCSWAKYVEIIYNNKKMIVFGGNILEITRIEPYQFNNKIIKFIDASDFYMKTSTLIEELSGCACGNDFLIQSDNKYSFVYNSKNYILFFDENEYGHEDLHSITYEKDTIYAKVEQGFQEGTGKYKLKIFENNNRWEFIQYDQTRDYNDN